jgi:ABC-type multidrug transport system ATPase subunit
MTETVLSFDHVSKRFGSFEVLKDVTISLKKGECAALTGLNGSGKTTLLKLAAGLARVSSGEVRTPGGIRLGYIPESFPRPAVSARSLLRSFGRIQGMAPPALDERINKLLEAFNLQDDAGSPLNTYSKGMLQKVCVLQAFLGRADILLLDEPLSGQDAASQETFIRLTKSLLSSGTAVLLACHEKYLLSALADTVYEVGGGTLRAAAATPQNDEDLYVFDLPGEGSVIPKGFDDFLRIKQEGAQALIYCRHGKGNDMLRALLDAGWRLKEMRHEKNG